MSRTIQILHRPAYAMARIDLSAGDAFLCEAGSMVSKSASINLEPQKVKRARAGGILGAVKSLLSGEFFLINKATATSAGHIHIAPTHVGDIAEHNLDGGLIIQSGSFLACDDEITLDGEWQGARSFFAGESLFMMHARGKGSVLFNSFGAIEAHDLDGEMIVDTGHIVAFEPTLTYSVTKFGSSWFGAFTSGEGLVARFSGKGRLYTQTRNLQSFGQMIGKLLPMRDS
jgi:uncharacterized protein (TIGR00266 family)